MKLFPVSTLSESLALTPWQRAITLTALPIFAAFFYSLFAATMFFDGDTNWHVATGLWVLDHHRVPATDPFSYTAAGRPWVTHEWLSEVLMAIAYRLAGWSGVRVLIAFFAAGATGLLAAWLQARVRLVTFLMMVGLCLYVLVSHLLARPHVIALPFLILWIIQLIRANDQKTIPPLWLLPIMTLWANLHGTYIIGLAYTCIFALEAVAAVKTNKVRTAVYWGMFIVGVTLAAMITPNGFEGLVYPFKVMSMTHLRYITEWEATQFTSATAFTVAFFTTLFFCFYLGVKVPLVRLGLLLLLLQMTLQHSRQELILAMTAPFLLAEPFAAALNATKARLARVEWPPLREVAAPASVIGAVFLAAAGWTVANPEVRTDWETVPVTAFAHVPASLKSRPVFNSYSFGGWLIFNHVKPFIDGRSDMYGDADVKRYVELDSRNPVGLDETFDHYGIVWSILRPLSGVVPALKAKGWRTLYADKWAIVQVAPNVVTTPEYPSAGQPSITSQTR